MCSANTGGRAPGPLGFGVGSGNGPAPTGKGKAGQLCRPRMDEESRSGWSSEAGQNQCKLEAQIKSNLDVFLSCRDTHVDNNKKGDNLGTHQCFKVKEKIVKPKTRTTLTCSCDGTAAPAAVGKRGLAEASGRTPKAPPTAGWPGCRSSADTPHHRSSTATLTMLTMLAGRGRRKIPKLASWSCSCGAAGGTGHRPG